MEILISFVPRFPYFDLQSYFNKMENETLKSDEIKKRQ